MTDRDTFAAAALTGLLAQGDDGSFSEESYARGAYRWADVMLRERLRSGAVSACETVPDPDSRTWETRQQTASDRSKPIKSPASSQELERTHGVRHTQAECTTQDECVFPVSRNAKEPVAWAVMDGTKTLVGYHSCSRDKAEAWAKEYGFPEVVPLYRHQHATVPLPRVPQDFEISEANGYAAAIEDFKRALAKAGVEWVE